MHIVQEEIGKPLIQEEKKTETCSVFTFSPLPSGFGHTLGNSLRRTLLSSVPGSGITKVKIKGLAHEYSSLEGLQDSALNLILNLKNVAFEKFTKDEEHLTISKKGEGDISASDIIISGDTKVINNDFIISSLTKDSSSLEMEMILEKGIGFTSAKEKQQEGDKNWILLDTIFSPVTLVRYEVLPARVGDITNLDTLKIEIETNGSISPSDSLQFSSQILEGYFSFLQNDSEEKIEEDFLADFSVSSTIVGESEEDQESYTPIEILNLSPRTLNALINGNIGSVEEVLSSTPTQLEAMRGFGKKAMSELVEALESHGYDFPYSV